LIKGNFAEEVDGLFKQWDKLDSPGCALAIIKDGKSIYKKGYGMADLEHDVPITTKTIFSIGSISKQFTAMCILLLVEQNKISLDDDIRKYLLKFPDYKKLITIRHLIHHASGIRDYAGLMALKGKNTLEMTNLTEREVLRLVFKQKELNNTPGEETLYSIVFWFVVYGFPTAMLLSMLRDGLVVEALAGLCIIMASIVSVERLAPR